MHVIIKLLKLLLNSLGVEELITPAGSWFHNLMFDGKKEICMHQLESLVGDSSHSLRHVWFGSITSWEGIVMNTTLLI